MWLHLGGSYWQRASYDAVVTLAALLGLLAVAPALRHARVRDWALAAAIMATLALFTVLAAEHLQNSRRALDRIERDGPR